MGTKQLRTTSTPIVFYTLIATGLAWMAFVLLLPEPGTEMPRVSSDSGSSADERPAGARLVESLGVAQTPGAKRRTGWAASEVPRADNGVAIENWRGGVPPAASRNTGGIEDRVRDGLVDADPDYRIEAVYRAYQLAPDVARPLLQGVIISETNGHVYEAAVEVLKDIAGESAVALVTTALGDPDADYRAQAVEELAMVGQPAVHLLGQALLGDPEPGMRLLAVQRLSEIPGPAAMSLLQAATRDSDPEVSRAAREAVAALEYEERLTGAGAIDPVSSAYFDFENDPEGLFTEFPQDAGPDERITAIRRAYAFDDDASIETLKSILARDEDLAVRAEALVTLEHIGGDTATAAIEVALGDDSAEIRHRAMETLWLSNDAVSLPVMGQVLYSDPDPGVRLEAVRLLATDSSLPARVLIEIARSDPDEGVSDLATSLSNP